MTQTTYCNEYAQVSRRAFLGRSLQAAGGLLFGNHLLALPTWMPRLHLADPHIGPRGDTLVCIFLRGGADGLNIVVPHGDGRYYDLRPTIAIPRPDDGPANGRALDLDGFFGLHPALEPLHAIYQAEDMAFIHATGSPDETRSHFEAMDLMERGAASDGNYSGWLARHLTTLDTGNESALRAIGVGDMLPTTLSGAVSATALQSIADYHLQGQSEHVGEMAALLQTLYAQDESLLTAVANQTFAAMDILGQLDSASYQPKGRAYPEQEFGQAMQMVAQLIRADVGVEVACIDLGGWDTHVAQGGAEGQQARLLAELGAGLAAFYEDLADIIGRVTVVVMSEFGRRAQENGGLGTDHGHGNMMMVLGGGVNGRTVYANWPGLHDEQLVGPGDLAITTDYRNVLGEILRKRLNNPLLDEVFPGYAVNELGLAVPRT
ncbi:MAG: DUF1501 domain-containing protein [Ardenticatenaceae bacterium]|nr:DUF1501 domain-containing protein [Anaerolineales bacterium]MCB8920954.1 DUF1501 domain-containing protein [Ardenticatenaceae bacterium]MCB8991620.1 DUF1501 domain-containing protein [Ardenticatenaceae bacterium]MCB9004249.1 DUF1501 domain-containing protein [Ardenticatenaceae bacterium]